MACLNRLQNSTYRVAYILGNKFPSQHSLLIQYWPYAGPATQMVAQQWANIG